MSRPRIPGGVRAALLALLVLAAGCSEKIDPRLAGRGGAAAYARYCLRCHGARGDGAKASRMAERPVDIGAPAFADTVDRAGLERVVARGKGKMEGYADKLSPAEIDSVARFVIALQDLRRREAAAPGSAGGAP